MRGNICPQIPPNPASFSFNPHSNLPVAQQHPSGKPPSDYATLTVHPPAP